MAKIRIVFVPLGGLVFAVGDTSWERKLHTPLDLRGAIPTFIHISDGQLHDVNVLDMLVFEAGTFYVMDRGYVDFSRLYMLHHAGAFFVTRVKSPMDVRRVYSATTDRATRALCCCIQSSGGVYLQTGSAHPWSLQNRPGRGDGRVERKVLLPKDAPQRHRRLRVGVLSDDKDYDENGKLVEPICRLGFEPGRNGAKSRGCVRARSLSLPG